MKSYIVLILFSAITMSGHARVGLSALDYRNNADTLPGAVLIINSFDAMSTKARMNKRELFRELTDSVKEYLARAIQRQTGKATRVIPGILSKVDKLDSMVYSLMDQYKSSRAILVWTGDVYFREGDSKEVEEYGGGTKTEVSYDMCARYEYTLYYRSRNLELSTVENCEYFTSRSSSGKFAIRFGPDIVGKKKHTYNIVDNNADKYIYQVAGKLGAP
jgi:hypothetical protein